MSTCAPGLNKNNFCHTWYVRTINGRIILYFIYLTGDNFFNFEVSIKSQNVKIQAFWEITCVWNWNSTVRTCKNKHCKKNSYKGIYVHPLINNKFCRQVMLLTVNILRIAKQLSTLPTLNKHLLFRRVKSFFGHILECIYVEWIK